MSDTNVISDTYKVIRPGVGKNVAEVTLAIKGYATKTFGSAVLPFNNAYDVLEKFVKLECD